MPKFRKRPMVIKAEQFWPDNQDWPDGVERYIREKTEDYLGYTNTWYGWRVHTKIGICEVRPGDWIITDSDGCYSHVNRDIFEATYEPVEEPNA